MRNLPALPKKGLIPPGMHLAVLVWFLIVQCIMYMGLNAAAGLFGGHLLSFIWSAVFLSALFWCTGGFLINVPLCLYLTNKFSKGDLPALHLTYRRVLRLWEKLPVAKEVNYAVGLSTLAFIAHTSGRYDESEQWYQKALAALQKNRQAAYPHLAALTNNYGSLLIRKQRYQEAEKLVNQSLQIWEAQRGREWNGSAIPLCTLALLCIETGDVDQAEEYLLNARRRFETVQDPRMILPDSMLQSKTACYLGLMLLYCRKQYWSDAFKFMNLATDLVAQRPISFGPHSLYVCNKIIAELLHNGKYQQAEVMLEMGYRTGGLYPDHPDTVSLLENYDQLLNSTGRASEISDMRRWIRPVSSIPKSITG